MTEGEQLRDMGIERVLMPEARWSDRYFALMNEWFKGRPEMYTFTGESLRDVALQLGLEKPHHPNAWGGVSRRFLLNLAKGEQIRAAGFAPARSAKSHAHAYRRYVKTVPRRYRFADDEQQLPLEIS